jgi:ZIP family zinc transporter
VVRAFGWGAFGAAALLVGALIAYLLSPSRQVIAVVMALGTGLLIGSVAFELIDEALDGIPESFVLGLTVLQGGVSRSLLAGVVLSNLPEGMSSSAGLKAAGWPRGRVLAMWSAVVLVSALSAAAGFALLDPASGQTGAVVQAFAGGALLAMLADTLLPEAYAVEGVLTGFLVVAGFAVSLALSG